MKHESELERMRQEGEQAKQTVISKQAQEDNVQKVALELMSKQNMPVDKAFETARVAVYGGSAGGPGGAQGGQ
jgi:hypothetical protein